MLTSFVLGNVVSAIDADSILGYLDLLFAQNPEEDNIERVQIDCPNLSSRQSDSSGYSSGTAYHLRDIIDSSDNQALVKADPDR